MNHKSKVPSLSLLQDLHRHQEAAGFDRHGEADGREEPRDEVHNETGRGWGLRRSGYGLKDGEQAEVVGVS